jgi:hypothetical protein
LFDNVNKTLGIVQLITTMNKAGWIRHIGLSEVGSDTIRRAPMACWRAA